MNKPLWQLYAVRFNFLTSLCGSVPANPDLVRIWLESRTPTVRPPQGKTIAQIQEEVFSTIATEAIEEEEIPKSLLVFQRIEGKLVVRAGTIRAHMKDCARRVGQYYVGKIAKEKAFSTRFIDTVYPDERQYWLPILASDGTPVKDVDGIKDKAVHTWQGNALKSIEWIMTPRIDFKLKVLGGAVKEDDIRTVFSYGGVHGYGGERGDGEGRYEFELNPIEEGE